MEYNTLWTAFKFGHWPKKDGNIKTTNERKSMLILTGMNQKRHH